MLLRYYLVLYIATDRLRCSQPVLADEVQTFKALITIHKVLQEGHPIVVREAQQHANWIDSLMRGVGGDGIRGTQSLQAERRTRIGLC